MAKKATSSGAQLIKPLTREQLGAPDALARIFSKEQLRRAFRRIVKRDKDDLVTHPLKKPLLIAFEEELCDQLADAVPHGRWSPTGAYLCLTLKRSGAFRELVFPTLIDGLVGRCLVDALEPSITEDDDGKTFSGRSHFSNVREPGDYDDWFAVWRDFTAAVDMAAERDGFAYVYDTDVNDFFPSIDRTKAMAMLAQRTGAHPSLLELLRYCLEAWLPRFQYSPMTGIPVECNDVSRLVAHNYLKSVDGLFKANKDCIYLRYVDDTIVFARTRKLALKLSRLHHLELRQLGLNPSSAKTQIMSVADFQAERHRDVNIALDGARRRRDVEALGQVIDDWYGRDRRATPGWDKITRKVYSLARQLRTDVLKPRVIDDVQRTPAVARTALYYLSRFNVGEAELQGLTRAAEDKDLDLAVSIEITRCCADARFEGDCSADLAALALRQLAATDDERPGCGYLRAVWLLVSFKHGNRRQREEALRGWQSFDDEQWRLHAILVAIAQGVLTLAQAGSACLLADSDLQLMLRLCGAAKQGILPDTRRVLNSCISTVNGAPSITARNLPLVTIIMNAPKHRGVREDWLREARRRKGQRAITDPAVLRHLDRWHDTLVS